MDAGKQYRSVLGLPGGLSSPLFPLVQKANTHGMALKAGHGGDGGDADEENSVWVMDTAAFPFWPAEVRLPCMDCGHCLDMDTAAFLFWPAEVRPLCMDRGLIAAEHARVRRRA